MVVEVSLYGWCYGLWCHLVVEMGSCESERKGASEREKRVSKPLTVVAGGKSRGAWPATGHEGA